MTTFMTILIVTFIDGSTYERPYLSARACSDAMPVVEALADEYGYEIDSVQCSKTSIITTSPIPKRRPEAI